VRLRIEKSNGLSVSGHFVACDGQDFVKSVTRVVFEEDYKIWPANKLVAEPQPPCLASFIRVKVNVSNLQADMIRWPRQRLEQMQHA